MSLCVRHLCQHFTFWYSLKKQITEILLNQLESIHRNDVCEVHFEKFLISWQLCKIHGHHWQFLFFLLIDWNFKKKKWNFGMIGFLESKKKKKESSHLKLQVQMMCKLVQIMNIRSSTQISHFVLIWHKSFMGNAWFVLVKTVHHKGYIELQLLSRCQHI